MGDDLNKYETPFILAVDIGTSSIKVGLYDALAHSVPDIDETVPHSQTVASDGTSEEDADQIRNEV